MDHISIKTALKNAKSADTPSPIIYMIFQKLTVSFRDIYYILTGNEEQVKKAIEKCYEETEQNKKDDWLSAEIKALDTPFDTYCGGHCTFIDLEKCKKDDKNKCCGDWIHHECKSTNEIDEYIKTVPDKVIHPYGRFEIWDMTEDGLIQRKI